MDNQNNNTLNTNVTNQTVPVQNSVPSEQIVAQNGVPIAQTVMQQPPQVVASSANVSNNSINAVNNRNLQAETIPGLNQGVQVQAPQVSASPSVAQPQNTMISAEKKLDNEVSNIKEADGSKFVSQPQQETVNQEPAVTSSSLPIDNLMNNQGEKQSFIKPVEQLSVSSTDDLLNAVPKPDMMISSPAESTISTDDLLEDYIGKNYEKMTNKKINFAAFFFSSFYMIYRKMVIAGILIYFLEMALMYLSIIYNPVLITIAFGINFIVSIVLLFLFNSIYIKNAKGKIDKIKKKNKVISVSELRKLCAKKGGTSIGLAIGVSIAIGIVFTISFNSLFPIDADEIKNNLFKSLNNAASKSDNSDETNNDSKKNNEKEKIDLSNLKYVEDISLEDKFTMQYLMIFTPTDSNSNSKYEYIKFTDENDDSTYCKFSLGITKDYKDSKKLLNDLSKYYKINTVEDINARSGLTWQNFLRENNGEKIYYASISNNEETYLFEYTVGANANESLCKAYYMGIINSIQFK
ncbi:MAG: hypothetical protein E7158_03375 [Firmicutes bacterium]|nr:hypothetical protein [Bacillota bacterium]